MSRFASVTLTTTLLFGAVAASAAEEPAPPPSIRTHNVVLVTLDGVRQQEIFGGLDETIGVHDAQQIYSEMAAMRERFGGADPLARRRALMPEFWNRLAPQGMVLGNPAYDNHVLVQNRIQWSTPGYTEILTGAPRPEVTDNDNLRHPWPTALEYVRSALGLDYGQVAEFGSWDGFKLAAASRDDAFLMVGAYDTVPAPWGNPEIDRLADLRRQVMGLWEEGSNDALTFRMALSYLRQQQPRLMWLALVNSDDWAHADRYDRYLAWLNRADGMLGELWDTLQSMDAYRDRTTLILTTDHGRGLQGSDWAEHDLSIPGSDAIWLAVIGPDTPDVGEVRQAGTAYQGQAAATLLQFFGLDAAGLGADVLPPVAGTLD